MTHVPDKTRGTHFNKNHTSTLILLLKDLLVRTKLLSLLLALCGLFFILSLNGCVGPNEAVSYAQRAYPECSGHNSLSHNYGGGESQGSQTEVSMTCGEVRKSITVKCVFGWGVFSDTTCHENN